MTTKTMQSNISDICNLVHSKCVVCGCNNGTGLHLDFDIADDQSVTAVFQCDEAFEGYPSVLHGGVISSILDGAMGNCMFARGQTAVTVEMTTKFRSPIATDVKAMVSAGITRISHPLYLLEAKIVQSGKVKATAKAKFYDQPGLINMD
ncbi:MAG: PaaI family thioesterase [Planctomycetes bacterium]|nr:PaaI family thioesterase [Planctomycetota bacterium]